MPEETVKHGADEGRGGASAAVPAAGAERAPGDRATSAATDPEGVRDRIMSVAQRLFAAKGYDATSVREIAEGVGVTVPALYYHFGSKRGILEAMVDAHCAHKGAAVDAALQAPGTWAERLQAGVRAYIAAMGSQVSAATVVMRDPSLFSDAELRGRVLSTERLVVDRFAAVVRAGVEAGEFRALDAPRVALLLVTAARGVHVGRMLTGEASAAEGLADTLLDLALDGLRRT